MNASNKYSLPVGRSALERMDLTSSSDHFGKLKKNAIDLVVPKNRPVLAAADVVTFVKDDSDSGERCFLLDLQQFRLN